MSRHRPKVHLARPGGGTICNSRHVQLTTRTQAEVTCALCLLIGRRAQPSKLH